MSVIVFAAPYVPPPPPTPPWRGYRVVWHGWDGSSWDLTDPKSGICLVSGVDGFHMPMFDDFTVRSNSGAGQRYKGSRAQPRRVSLNLLVYSDIGSEEWETLNDRFWRSMRPDLPGWIEITSPTGKVRTIDLRYTPQTSHVFDRDPVKDGWALYQPDFTADYPYYMGPEVTAFEWESEVPTDPFIPLTGGPPFSIINATGTAEATLENPGDVPLYLDWHLEGELSAQIRVAGGLLGVPTVPEGYTLDLYTDPRRAAAVMTGPDGVQTDVWESITPWDPRKLLLGERVPITLALVGTGKISATYRAAYFRAT